MLELSPSQFSLTAPLFQGNPQVVLPSAVLQGINPGRIFADSEVSPRLALLGTPVGYFFLAGEPPDPERIQQTAQVLADCLIPELVAQGERGFILVAPPAWQDSIPALLPDRPTYPIFRRPFAFDPGAFTRAAAQLPPLPPNFRLERMSTSLAERAGLPPTWPSPADFVEKGLGFAILEGETIASTCLSVFASRTHIELDIFTAEPYRRQGLAAQVTAACIRACLDAGRSPNWECFWENEDSVRLARRLGFEPLPDYPVTYWEA